MNSNQAFIQRARQEIFGAQRKRAVAKVVSKKETEATRRELELFLDDLRFEGIDPTTPAGLAIAIRALLLKRGENVGEGYRSSLEEDWPEGM